MAITTTDGGTPHTRPEDEYLGVGKTLGYGTQHILAMFGGVIAVPLIVGGAAGLDTAQKALLVASGLFVSGLATMLQTLAVPFFGSRLPLVQGTSFATVSTILTILAGDPEHGLRVVFGSLLVAAAIGLAITPFFARVIRFFPPVVTGSIITVIGLSLMPVAAGWITGQPTITVDGQKVANPDFAALPSIGLAMFTFLAVVLLSKVRVFSRLSVLLGLAVGTVVALIFGRADVGAVGSASVFSLPTPSPSAGRCSRSARSSRSPS